MKQLCLLLFMASLLVSSQSALSQVACEEEGELSAVKKIESLLDVVETKSKISFGGYINKSSISRLIKKIDKAVEKNKGTRQIITISLSSHGGNINEAIRAIQHIRNLNNDPLIEINTKVSSYSDCESACTILFTAGERRFASERSEFGFHSPKLEKGKIEGMTRDEIEERYRQIWLRYIAMVDPTTASRVESSRYLYDDDMSYISGRNLATGYVTDFL